MINKIKYADKITGFVNIFYEDGSVKNLFSANEEVQQYIADGGVIEPEFTEEELRLKEIDSQIQEAKAYLTETGWIWEKYNRNVLVLKDMTSEEFNLKYSDIISKQEEYRALINELEGQLEVING